MGLLRREVFGVVTLTLLAETSVWAEGRQFVSVDIKRSVQYP